MAIHHTVLYTPDRRYRITADTSGRRFTVEDDNLVLVATYTDLAAMESFLADHGYDLADLITD